MLHSIERPSLSAVYGTPEPPSGVSGAIRRFAFRYSEGKWAHWLSLIFADRVNVLEGYAEDFRNKTVPNVFAEQGWKGMWKHNPKLVVRKVGTAVVICSVVLLLLQRKKMAKR